MLLSKFDIITGMSESTLSKGLVHEIPADMTKTLTKTKETIILWNQLTDIGRNEFICWVLDAKKETTRARRIQRTVEELLEGKKRPCCWPGCPHRRESAKKWFRSEK